METDICVIGAGPAGSTLAARLAQLGHDVYLVERSRFPRPRLGESLTPGVLPLLDVSGSRGAVEAAGFPSVDAIEVDWEATRERRTGDDGPMGLLVDRGRFDAILLRNAEDAGVHVLQPASALDPQEDAQGWTIPVDRRGRRIELKARFLVEARGRSPDRGRLRPTGPGTLALYAYWRGRSLPRRPRIQAGRDAWYWGVPLPDGHYNTLLFVDKEAFQSDRYTSVDAHFRQILRESDLLRGYVDLELASPVRAVDATPYLAEDCIGTSSIRVGDAALAVDPISSSGVQKAIQTALSGAVVVNTLLRDSASRDLATAFYRGSLERAGAQHGAWASGHYARAAERWGTRFWRDRADVHARLEGPVETEDVLTLERLRSSSVTLSAATEFVQVPCLDGEFVRSRSALQHPGLGEPVAYVAGVELAPLLRAASSAATPIHLAQAWSMQVPLPRGLAVVDWLIRRGILEAASGRSAPGGLSFPSGA